MLKFRRCGEGMCTFANLDYNSNIPNNIDFDYLHSFHVKKHLFNSREGCVFSC